MAITVKPIFGQKCNYHMKSYLLFILYTSFMAINVKKSHIFPQFQKQVIPSSVHPPMLLGHDVHIKLQMHCLNPQSDKSTCGQKFLLQCQGKVKFPRNKMCSINMIYLFIIIKKESRYDTVSLL